MKLPFFLTISKSGKVKVNKSRPSLDWDEISVHVTMNIPDALFKRPAIAAEITIPESAAIPSEISAEVKDNIKEAIQQAAGMEVKITFDNNKPDNQ